MENNRNENIRNPLEKVTDEEIKYMVEKTYQLMKEEYEKHLKGIRNWAESEDELFRNCERRRAIINDGGKLTGDDLDIVRMQVYLEKVIGSF